MNNSIDLSMLLCDLKEIQSFIDILSSLGENVDYKSINLVSNVFLEKIETIIQSLEKAIHQE